MPEGHTIHRAARLHRRALRGRPVRADSPQGRFAAGAAALDGCTLLDVEAHGKHLFYRWSSGDTLHVHLGLFGKFRTVARQHPDEPLPPTTPGTRLRLVADDLVLQLAGPTDCSLMDPVEEDRVKARLGPDPLRSDADPEAMWAALRRRRIPIGAALLDQSVVSGIGNVYRCELLYVIGAWPGRPARELERDEFDALWSAGERFLRAGERSGRIITVDPTDVGARSAARLPAGKRHYVYRRTGLPCRRCATPVERWEVAARWMYACPVCQPR